LGIFRRPSVGAVILTAVLLFGNVVTLFFFASLFMQQLPAFLVAGLGLGPSFVSVQIVAFTGTKEHESGLVAGLINISQGVGGAIGLAVAATCAFHNLTTMIPETHGAPALLRQARALAFYDAFLVGAFSSARFW
jgi:hypothetical protein